MPPLVLLAAGHEYCVVVYSLHSVFAVEQDMKSWAGRQALVMDCLHVHNMRRCAGVFSMPQWPVAIGSSSSLAWLLFLQPHSVQCKWSWLHAATVIVGATGAQ